MRFCCEKKCFQVVGDEVDGMACDRCRSFCYCKCRCQTFQERDNFEELKDLVRCPVCLELCKSVNFLTIDDCQHKFCKKCIFKWLDANNECPLCHNQTMGCHISFSN